MWVYLGWGEFLSGKNFRQFPIVNYHYYACSTLKYLLLSTFSMIDWITRHRLAPSHFYQFHQLPAGGCDLQHIQDNRLHGDFSHWPWVTLTCLQLSKILQIKQSVCTLQSIPATTIYKVIFLCTSCIHTNYANQVPVVWIGTT